MRDRGGGGGGEEPFSCALCGGFLAVAAGGAVGWGGFSGGPPWLTRLLCLRRRSLCVQNDNSLGAKGAARIAPALMNMPNMERLGLVSRRALLLGEGGRGR